MNCRREKYGWKERIVSQEENNKERDVSIDSMIEGRK
jgi:hypothetical protein